MSAIAVMSLKALILAVSTAIAVLNAQFVLSLLYASSQVLAPQQSVWNGASRDILHPFVCVP